MAVRKLAQRKDELFTNLLVRHEAGFDRCDRLYSLLPWPILSTHACMFLLTSTSQAGRPRVEQPGVRSLLQMLRRTQVPTALACASPAAIVNAGLESTGLAPLLDMVLTADDVARGPPDPEVFLAAAQQLGRPPVRCVVLCSRNSSIEAARDAGMRAVAVAGPSAPQYELSAADLVVSSLDAVSYINLKQLFASEIEDMEALRGPGFGRDDDDDLYTEEEDDLDGDDMSKASARDDAMFGSALW